LTQDKSFYPYPQKKEQEALPKKKFHLLLSYECASESKRKRENPRSKIGGKQRKKRKFPIKDWKKSKRKEKIPNQRLEKSKRKGKFPVKDRKKAIAKYAEWSPARKKRKTIMTGDA